MCCGLNLCPTGYMMRNAITAADAALESAAEQGVDDETIDALADECERACVAFQVHLAAKCRDKGRHIEGCTRENPLCRWRKSQAKTCSCGAYHFPHRAGSRACRIGVPLALLNSPGFAERMNATGPDAFDNDAAEPSEVAESAPTDEIPF
jgi:hypothetical protein